MNRWVLNRYFWLLPVAIWGGLALGSLSWNRAMLEQHAEELAVQRARFVFKVIESVRLWNARHGGVYAPISEETPPNNWLEVPERDIHTPGGTPLTMVNPAYMTRQVALTIEELSGIHVHLTSLKPLNPHNQADPWEGDALRAFERGATERFELLAASEQPTTRYMAPLVVAKACLKCHEKQGYKEGDIRGGLSVSFPATELMAATAVQRTRLAGVHGVAWLLLSVLTWFAHGRIRRHLLDLQQAKAEQDRLVEQRTAELRRQEASVRQLIESSGEGIFGLDAAGRCSFCNPTALRLLGYECADELLGREVEQQVLGSEGRHHFAETYREGRAVHADDGSFRRADGSRFPVEFRSHPLQVGGEVVGAVVTFSDITERRAAEETLRKLSNAVEHSPESVVITDLHGRIEYVNPKFLETTGYDLAEVIGQKPGFIRSGQTPPATYQDLWNQLNQGEGWNGQFLNRRKNGELFWEDVSISPIRDQEGRVTHYVGLKEDITERKELEARIWHQANFDALTGLPNRSLFYDRLHQALIQADRQDSGVGVLFIDLDHFKEVNDSFGHEAGDCLLKEAAERLQGCVRESDTVARMGGDEFTIILPHLHQPEEAETVAAKVVARMAAPFEAALGVVITASVGVVSYPEHGRSASELLRHADAAMYQAKAVGRNAFRRAPSPQARRA